LHHLFVLTINGLQAPPVLGNHFDAIPPSPPSSPKHTVEVPLGWMSPYPLTRIPPVRAVEDEKQARLRDFEEDRQFTIEDTKYKQASEITALEAEQRIKYTAFLLTQQEARRAFCAAQKDELNTMTIQHKLDDEAFTSKKADEMTAIIAEYEEKKRQAAFTWCNQNLKK
jgi:hypothetical protein